MYTARLPLHETARALRSGRMDLLRHVEQACDRMEEVEPHLQALLPEPDRRRRLAAEAARLLKRYPDPVRRPPLFGVLVGVKDIFRADGFPTRAGSRLPGELFDGEEAAVVTRLREAGALVAGKTVTTEFAYFEPGPTRNPRHPAHTPGGSSSGSAAGVAAGEFPLALGTQTIGSVIRPAAFCGIIGFKPSFGRIPTAGLIPFSRSLDHVGLFAQDAAGMALAAAALCDRWEGEAAAATESDVSRELSSAAERRCRRAEGRDARSACLARDGQAGAGAAGGRPQVPARGDADVPREPGRAGAARAAAGRRPVLAVPEGPYLDRASEEGRAAFAAQLARLERAGVTVRRVPFFAGFEELERGHRRLMAAEAAQVHEGWYTRFADRYSRHMHAIMETGRAVDETEQARLRRARLELRESLDAALSRQGADLWAAPAAAGPAPEGIASTGDPIMSLPWTNAGVPNLTLPAGAARNGLPLGLQLAAPFGRDERLLAWAAALEGVLSGG